MAHSPAGWLSSAADTSATTVLLVRHGQTELSVQRRYSGRGNPGLDVDGHAQARAIAAALRKLMAPSGGEGSLEVVSSPLRRCQETAHAIAAATGAAVHTDEQLIETDFGRWEGLTFAEAAAQDPEQHRAWLGDPAVPPPSGESFAQVRERVLPAVERWSGHAAGRLLAIVTHVTPIKLVLQDALTAGPELLYRLHLDVGQISEIRRYGDGGISVHRINDTSHLREPEE